LQPSGSLFNWVHWVQQRDSVPLCLRPNGDTPTLDPCGNIGRSFAKRSAQSTASANPQACRSSEAESHASAGKHEDRPSEFPTSQEADGARASGCYYQRWGSRFVIQTHDRFSPPCAPSTSLQEQAEEV